MADRLDPRSPGHRCPSRLRSRLRARLGAAASRGDDGFTLMETVMALLIVGSVLLLLVYGQVLALKSTNVTKQREQLTSLANRYIEQMRALPYAKLQAGMNSADLAGDPNITVAGSVSRFTPAYDSSIDEEILSTSGQTAAPLYPHVQPQVTQGTSTYRVSLYVTKTADYSADLPSLWVTAVASRVSGPGSAPKPIVVRTQVFSPKGCMSTTTRPYAGPCQAFFYSNSGITQGSIMVDGAGGSTLETLFGASDAQLVMPGITASTATEQTTTIEASAATSGVAATTDAGTDVTSGQSSAGSLADDDPSSAAAANPPAVTATQPAGAEKTFSGTLGSLTLTPGSATADAVTAAKASAGVPCRDVANAVTTTAMPCAAAKLSALADSVKVTPGGGLGSFSPATIATSGTPGRAWAGRLTLTQNSHCTGLAQAGTVGCVAGEAKRATGTITVGAVPGGGTSPAGWTGSLVQVTSYSNTAYSEQGVGIATAPTKASTSSRTGTITYWNGTTYVPISLGTGTVSQTLGTATFSYAGGTIGLSVTGWVGAAARTVTTTGPAGCSAEACTTKTEVPGVQATVVYTFTGAVTGSFQVNVDLGSALASTTYKAAPT